MGEADEDSLISPGERVEVVRRDPGFEPDLASHRARRSRRPHGRQRRRQIDAREDPGRELQADRGNAISSRTAGFVRQSGRGPQPGHRGRLSGSRPVQQSDGCSECLSRPGDHAQGRSLSQCSITPPWRRAPAPFSGNCSPIRARAIWSSACRAASDRRRHRPHAPGRGEGDPDGRADGRDQRPTGRAGPCADRAPRDQGHSVVLISHRMPDVFSTCDRVIVLRRGRKVADKPIALLVARGSDRADHRGDRARRLAQRAFSPLVDPVHLGASSHSRQRERFPSWTRQKRSVATVSTLPGRSGRQPVEPWRRLVGSQEFWITIAVIGDGAVVSDVTPRFATYTNLSNVLQNFCYIGILAIGMTPILITGGIDISVGSILGLCGVVLGLLLQADWPLWAGLPATLWSGRRSAPSTARSSPICDCRRSSSRSAC